MPIETDHIHLWAWAHATPESFTHGGDSDPLHANLRKIVLHSPEYHGGCPYFLGAAGAITMKLAATSQHTCPCNITKTTPKPHSKKPGFLIQAPTLTLPSFQAMLEHHLPRLANNVPFTSWTRSPEFCAMQRQPDRTALPSQLTSEMLL